MKIRKTVKNIFVIGIILGSIMCNIRMYNTQQFMENELQNKETKIKEINSLYEDLQKKNKDLENKNSELEEKNKKLEIKIEEVLPTPLEDVHFNPNDLTEQSNANTARINKMLEGTALNGLGSSYKKAEEEYGVNAVFLVSLTAEESGWGTSRRAREDNNMSGFEVYNDSSEGASFSTKHESIMTTGKLLSKHYLDKNGKYYKGKDIYAVNTTYCPVGGYSWSNNITNIANSLLEE